MGGIWAQIEIRHQYDEEAKGKRSPFWIEGLKPIQLATFDLEEYRGCRRQFTTDEWIDLLLRTIGLEPTHFLQRRLKLLFLHRLLPLCEQNYNLVELGPRGTGKSYVYQELSPYTILLTGPTTVANLFYNMASGKMGLVGIWDAIGFDEVADLQKMPKEVVTTLKTYCESGAFARGKDALSGMASIAMFGNKSSYTPGGEVSLGDISICQTTIATSILLTLIVERHLIIIGMLCFVSSVLANDDVKKEIGIVNDT